MENKKFKINRNIIKSKLGIDDFVADLIEGESEREIEKSFLNRHLLLCYGFLSLLTNLLFPLNGMKRKIKTEREDFILVSCPDIVFRTQNISLITEDLRYCIIYLPNFRVSMAIKYHKYFHNKGTSAFFPTIKLGQVLSVKKLIKSTVREMHGIGKDLDSFRVLNAITNYLIYDQVAKKYMKQVESFNGKWILEHQKFFFIASVANLHEKGIPSTMLQHGIFFKPNYFYIPLVCNNVLCCSEREKNIYLNNGVKKERVFVLGAPLQTLQQSEQFPIKGKHYEMLIMLAIINNQNVELVRNVLNYVKTNYKSVLVRMRPRSRSNDEAQLSDVLQGMSVSEAGVSISEDIMRCDKIISFSVDANIEVSKYHKPFIFIVEGEQATSEYETNYVTSENYKQEIIKLMENDFYSSFSEKQYKEVLGETDVNVIRERFVEYIRN